jgi:hypothetical protein
MFTNRNYLRARIKKRQGKNFYPGHYLYTTREGAHGMPSIGSTDDINMRQLVYDNPNFMGYLNKYIWASLEPSLGVYNFSKIFEDLEISADDGKVMIVGINERTFSNSYFPGPSYMNPASPDYDDEYEGAYFTPEAKSGFYPNLAMPKVTDRTVALLAALGASIKDHPALSAIALVETAVVGLSALPGYSNINYLSHFIRVHDTVALAFPNTLIYQTVNWFAGLTSDQVDTFMVNLVETHKGAFGATDIIAFEVGNTEPLPTLDTPFGPYYTKYRGKAPIVVSAQAPTYNIYTARIQYDYAVNDIGAHIIAWQPNRGFAGDPTYTIYDVIDVVNEENGRTNTTIPSNILE